MNKYDKEYDARLKRRYVPSGFDWNRKDEVKCEEATKRQPRSKQKSALAKEEGYSLFLELVNDVLGERYHNEEGIFVKWVTGGITGGNCWGDEADQPVSPDEPEELTQLDQILERVSPEITFLQYKSLVKDVVVTGSYTQHEYYGNFYCKAVKYCLFSELYAALKQRGFIE